MNKKHILLAAVGAILAALLAYSTFINSSSSLKKLAGKPNFLLIMTDDQSWIHTSFAGYAAIKTPNFDRLAREGVYFENTYSSAPTCTASRSAILAGQHFWRTREGAQLWGEYPPTLMNYQKLLQQYGYKTGYTGKGWGPGKVASGNPAGPVYNSITHIVDAALSPTDHVANLRIFLREKKPGQPFSFWLTPTEPHRPYKAGSGVANGIDLATIQVPEFLPDTEAVRNDIADYLYEIEYFDAELGRILDLLKQAGELDNTVIVYTSDNGMPFPRAKSNNYEYGTRVPLAVRWGAKVAGGQRVTDFISLIDLAPTFLTLAGIPVPVEMSGKSFDAQLLAGRSGRIDAARDAIFSGFERHIGNARSEHQGYPSRAIHTDDALYIYNFSPDRWPAGNPPAYEDIDNLSPSKNAVIDTDNSFRDLAGAKRPQEELFLLKQDPYQVHNLAGTAEYNELHAKLSKRLFDELRRSADPQVSGNGHSFDTYPYHGADPD